MTLTVTLNGQPITKNLSGLVTRSVSPGGFSAVSFNLNRKLDASLLEQFTDILVFDASTGEQVGGGRLLDQGRNDDGSWAVTCLGEGLASMQDREEPYFLIDGTLDNWVRSTRTTRRLDATATVYPNATINEPSLVCDANDGVVIAINDEIIMTNQLPLLCDQYLGGLGFKHKAGQVSANWRIRGRAYTDAALAAFDTAIDDAWDTALSARLVVRCGTNWTTATRAVAGLQWKRLNATQLADDTTWHTVKDPVIRAQIYNAQGTLRTTGYTNEYLTIDEAFTDMLVRFCPRLDAAGAAIAVGAYQIDQAAWLDGITAMDAMTDLINLEAAFTWHVWEKSGTKWVTELVQLPTTVRYDATTRDGFTAPSPTTEIYNRVKVRWKSQRGYTQTTTVTSTVAALDDAGVIRTKTLDLSDEVGSTAQATRRGSLFLAEHATAPNGGTLTIARRIYDNGTGRWVQPWNIRPGGLIRVRGVQAQPDTANATSPDGTTVFRIVSTEYTDADGTCVLELDDYTLTESRAIATLIRRRRRKR